MERAFSDFICSIGFQASNFDPCLYLNISSGQCVLLLVYFDIVLVTGSLTEMIARTSSDLKMYCGLKVKVLLSPTMKKP